MLHGNHITLRTAAHVDLRNRGAWYPLGVQSEPAFRREFAGWGHVTEAVQRLVDYPFEARQQHRLQLLIVPDNGASRRIAAQCGVVAEGTARGAFCSGGGNADVLPSSLLRTDPRRWRGAERVANG